MLGAADNPTNSDGVLINIKEDSYYGFQEYHSNNKTIWHRNLSGGSWTQWDSFVSNSDLGYVDYIVDTVGNTAIPIPDSPSSYYIPVVVSHGSTLAVIEHVFFATNTWMIYSNVSQKVQIRFYKYPV